MPRGWRRVAEWAAARSGVPAMRRRLISPSGVVLAYHNIVPAGESPAGDASLHIDQRAFASQLDLLVETHDIVALEDLFAPEPRTGAKPRAVVTFDDAYTGAVTAGLDEVAARGVPATVFVAPGILDTEGCWWDLLSSEAVEPLSDRIRTHALHALGGKQALILDWAAREGLRIRSLPTHARPAARDALLARAAEARVSLGAHTWSHPNLATLSREECFGELRRSLDWLKASAPRLSNWLAYPYGLRSQAAVEEARALFDGALLVDGGHAVVRGRPRGSAHCAPRINVPRGMTLDGLRLRLSGLGRS